MPLLTVLLWTGEGWLVNLAPVGLDLGSLGSLHNEQKGSARSSPDRPIVALRAHYAQGTPLQTHEIQQVSQLFLPPGPFPF